MAIQIYQSKERIKNPTPYDPTQINTAVALGKQVLKNYQARDLKQRNSDATIEMLNIETSISNKLVDVKRQVDTDGYVDGVKYTDVAEKIRLNEYEGFNPPAEYKDQYGEQQAVYQASQATKSYEFYSAIRAKKATTDLKETYGNIAILASRETANENLEKIKLLVDNANVSETQKGTLLTSMTQGHNNQMYRNDINNPANNVARLEFQYEEFKKNRYSVGLENHKTIDKLFISKIKTKKIANVASDKAQKKYQTEQIIILHGQCANIDSISEKCDFKPYIKDPDYTLAQREKFKNFENVQKPLRPLLINMAAGYSAEIDEVRAKLETTLTDEESSIFTKDNVKKKLNYMDTMRSQFEVKIRQPDGIHFVIAELNKGDDTDIMKGAERLSAEWMGKANSIMKRLGVSENDRMLLPRKTREQLTIDPFKTIKSVLGTAEQEGWDDTTRRVAIKEMNKVTGLPKGTPILLLQDSTKGIRALQNYKNNKELYKKSNPLIKFDTDIVFKSANDPTREKLRLSGLPAEDLTRFDNAVEIQTLSTWETTNGEINDIFKQTYQEIIDKDFVFSSDKINGGYLRFDTSEVSQDLADEYTDAVKYIINEPKVLDEVIFWNAISGEYDKDEMYDLISDAKIVSINNDSEFAIVADGMVIPLTKQMTWQHTKEIYDKHITEQQFIIPNPKLNL